MCNCVFDSALDLAQYIIQRTSDNQKPVSNLVMQYMLYMCQHYFLCRDSHHAKCAFPEAICVFNFGPAVPVVYYYYCGYGSMPISVRKKKGSTDRYPSEAAELDDLIDRMANMEVWELASLVMSADSPWHEILEDYKSKQVPGYSDRLEMNSIEIPVSKIKNHVTVDRIYEPSPSA